jgi:hypothetical protein
VIIRRTPADLLFPLIGYKTNNLLTFQKLEETVVSITAEEVTYAYELGY